MSRGRDTFKDLWEILREKKYGYPSDAQIVHTNTIPVTWVEHSATILLYLP